MRDHPIVISEPDARVLRGLLSARGARGHDQEHLEELSLELERAQVLKPEQVAADVVTMHKPPFNVRSELRHFVPSIAVH